ncbi:LysE family translocator [Polymorphum gilvum]|uniref:Translocator protein, LysE family n=1 Tax=Polymorphum gilvum (strain LMG 25793 / CGMCC 1.9160 / SL003B-26A1) TaxID=991905 RepID=F2IZ24_POLGS|nr:LysE family transporter [Polymorphum gilvum]ADZ71747.1 Translocator protein, LysE family [Polymorphum gilvum SL003B-26A1]
MEVNLAYLLIGLAIGVITTAPVGPVNVMAIQRAFHRGFHHGFVVGLGAVAADTLYAAVAVFGISAVAHFVEGHDNAIQAVGGVLLIVFGYKVMQVHPHLDTKPLGRGGSDWGAMTGAFLMTLTNPGVVLGFVAIFGSLGEWAPDLGDHVGALFMVAGVAGGATLWWAFVAGAVSLLRDRLTDAWLDGVNRVAGLALIGFAVLIYLRLALIYFG